MFGLMRILKPSVFGWLLAAALLPAGVATAQEWAVKMFDSTSHDFQTVRAGRQGDPPIQGQEPV